MIESAMQSKEHWNSIYTSKSSDRVSWFQTHAKLSLQLINETGVLADASIIDVGGGASTLFDDLLDSGFSQITVLDLSAVALVAAQQRLGVSEERRGGKECVCTCGSRGSADHKKK